MLAACGDDVDQVDADVAAPDAPDSGPDTSEDGSPVDAVDSLDTVDALDIDGDDAPDTATCGTLFGVPGPATGLSSEQCAPTCGCGADAWTPPSYTAQDLSALRAWTLVDPPVPQETSPYETPEDFPERPAELCGWLVVDAAVKTYRTQTFGSLDALAAAGATLTHEGACGMCSSLEDLAVYIDSPDLTGPVRQCGLLGFREGEEANIACLLDLGFTEPCARIWYHNTAHTRTVCIAECAPRINAPHHEPDGALNPCLQCDEDRSGPIFKAVAGRTRRNSSLPSGLCRPCDDIARIVHRYEP